MVFSNDASSVHSDGSDMDMTGEYDQSIKMTATGNDHELCVGRKRDRWHFSHVQHFATFRQSASFKNVELEHAASLAMLSLSTG